MDVKSVQFSLKSISDRGEFSGYAAIFNNVDFGNDIVMPGAFKRTLADSKGDIPILWKHDDLIGRNLEAREDSRGLWVHGELNLDVQAGREAHSLAKQGAVRGLSIGFLPVNGKVDFDNDGNRILREIKLFEYSLTPLPMNPEARLVSVKQQDDPTHEEAVQALHRVEVDLKSFYRKLFDA